MTANATRYINTYCPCHFAAGMPEKIFRLFDILNGSLATRIKSITVDCQGHTAGCAVKKSRPQP